MQIQISQEHALTPGATYVPSLGKRWSTGQLHWAWKPQAAGSAIPSSACSPQKSHCTPISCSSKQGDSSSFQGEHPG